MKHQGNQKKLTNHIWTDWLYITKSQWIVSGHIRPEYEKEYEEMGNVYDDVMTKCPYYAAASRYSIRCEGLIKDTELLTKFKDVPNKREFQQEHCWEYPNKCPIAMEHDKRLKQE